MGVFHIHIDAALLPHEFEIFVKENFGFYDDDFEHALTVEGRALSNPVRHLTRKLGSREPDKNLLKTICERIGNEA